MPKKTIILDSSQIDTFLTCPQMWQYNYVELLGPAAMTGRGEAMLMGTYGHKLLEIYYSSLSCEESQSNSIEQALAFDIDKPEPFPLEKPVRAAIQQRFREYCYTYTKNDFMPTSAAHVEVGFSHKLFEDSANLFILEGRIDGIGHMSNNPIWIDHKFQLRSRNLYKKSIQFRNYALATGINLGIVNYVRLTKGVTKDTFQREITSFTMLEMNWWTQKLINIFHCVANGIQMQRNYASCSGKFGYPCNYTPLCEEIIPSIAEAKKPILYSIRKEWKPW